MHSATSPTRLARLGRPPASANEPSKIVMTAAAMTTLQSAAATRNDKRASAARSGRDPAEPADARPQRQWPAARPCRRRSNERYAQYDPSHDDPSRRAPGRKRRRLTVNVVIAAQLGGYAAITDDEVMVESDYTFGISEYTTMPWSFERDLERFPALGARAIELCEQKLSEDAGERGEQLERLTKSGLTVGSVQGKLHTVFPDNMNPTPEKPEERSAKFRTTIEHLASAARNAPFVVNTGHAPKGNVEEAWSIAVREFRGLCAFAAEHGVRIALEPLNPQVMNKDTFVWSLPQALDMLRDVDHPAFGVCVDVWNLWQDPLLAEHIRACGDRIFVVQVSDWRRPRSFLDRTIVGHGPIDMAGFMGAVDAMDFKGPYALEIFSKDVPDSLYDDDLNMVVSESKRGLDVAWQRRTK